MLFTAEAYPGFRQAEFDLLNAFSSDIPDADLQEMRQMIAAFLDNRPRQYAIKAEPSSWTVEDAEQFLSTKIQVIRDSE